MKVEVSELTGPALDWAVNQIEECCDDPHTPLFSTSWSQGGPIIEQQEIALEPMTAESAGDGWLATRVEGSVIYMEFGPTMLIAAMRCFVASKLGDEVEIPEELL